MLVYNLTEEEATVLENAGLTVHDYRVIGPADEVEPTHPILIAYKEFSEYATGGFVLYVNDESPIKKKLEETNSELLEGNLLVGLLRTYDVIEEITSVIGKDNSLFNILIKNWGTVMIHSIIDKDMPPKMRVRYIYAPKVTIYQIKYKHRYYAVSVELSGPDISKKYATKVSDLPVIYDDEILTKREVTNYLKDYLG